MSRRQRNDLWGAITNQLEQDYGYTSGEVEDMINAYLSGDQSTPPGYDHKVWSVALSRFGHAKVQIDRRRQERAPRQEGCSGAGEHGRERGCNHDGRIQGQSIGEGEAMVGASGRQPQDRGRNSNSRAQHSDDQERLRGRESGSRNAGQGGDQDGSHRQLSSGSRDRSRSQSTDDERHGGEMRSYYLAAQQRAEQERMNEVQIQLQAQMYGPTMMYLGHLDNVDNGSGFDVYGHLW